MDGKAIGRHEGACFYTVGQRKGLGIAAPEPFYVLELDLEAGRLVVGSKEELKTLTVVGEDFVSAVPDFPARWSGNDPLPGNSGSDGIEAVLRIRHRHGGARVGGWTLEGGRIRVDLVEPVDGAAPGQGLVLYGGDMVLGGARITSDSR